MDRQASAPTVDRRSAMRLGLGGIAALAAGAPGRADAQKGVEFKNIRQAHSMIPGYATVQLTEVILQPGVKLAASAMTNPMICECTLGTLEVTQDGKTFTAPTGFVWTCAKGTVEGAVNKGSTPAIMRVFNLLPG